jgi:predicted PurR-regulated permease PerM
VVPYLGVVVGILLAGIAALAQFQEWIYLLAVLLVFGVGQLLESLFLTPILVGDKIGLHPVVVIFAILAGGQLFGFVGVLLALPVTAILSVLAAEGLSNYKASHLYNDELGESSPKPKE